MVTGKEKEKDIQAIEVATEVENQFQLPNGDIVKKDDYLVWMGNTLMEIKAAVC